MKRQRPRWMMTLALWMMAAVLAFGEETKEPTLKVTVNIEEAGTLFTKIQAQIEEVGELTDISELTVTGVLNRDDYNVISHQITEMTKLDLSGVTNGDEGLFVQHAKVQQVLLPPNLTKIGYEAFRGCSMLKSLDIPVGVKEIGERAFRDCVAFETFSWPENVTVIEDYMFYGCYRLKEITLPSTLTEIHSYAFWKTGFTTFTLPAGIRLNGYAIFSESKLEEFIFSDGLKTAEDVGNATFKDCWSLKKVRLPQDLEEIPSEFFYNVPLDTLALPATLKTVHEKGFYKLNCQKRIVLPEGITSIGAQAFYLSGVVDVVWPSTCHIMKSDCFRYCGQLERIELPETLDSLQGYGLFLECTRLKEVRLPDAIRYVAGGLFSGCYALKDVNIPAACVSIGDFAYYRVPLTHINLPDGVTRIGTSAFEGCPLEELVLPPNLKVVEGEAFNGGKYKRVVVPEGCQSIGTASFYSDSLRMLDLPSTVIFMNGNPVGNPWNPHLDSLVMRSLVPPYLRDRLFGDRDGKNATLYVPAGSVAVYRNAPNYEGMVDIKALEGAAEVAAELNITGRVTISKDANMGNRKYDVNYLLLDMNRERIGGYQISDHPTLTIEEGATLHATTLKMTCDRDEYHWAAVYKWDVFINKGTFTADQIDLRWRLRDLTYFSPAFDTRVEDIVPEVAGAPFVFFRYDTSARAVSDFANSWKQLTKKDTLRAGVGYLVRADEMFTGQYDEDNWGDMRPVIAWIYQHHYPVEGGVNYFTTSEDVTLPMTFAAGEFAHNKNWNLVGQPYPAYFDIRGLDYDGPILLPTTNTWERWKAYSPLDDECVLEPMQAFFVQVPDGKETITLDADRRQTGCRFIKGEENTAAGARAALRRAQKNESRVVFNATLSPVQDEQETSELQQVRTRFVINPEATLRYDIGRDAPAMADNDTTLLLYTMAGGVAYAINERPLDDGIIRLGMQVNQSGTYQLALTRKEGRVTGSLAAEKIWLIDNETGTRFLLLTTDGSEQQSYTFTVDDPTTLSERFIIAIGDAEPTAITEVERARPMCSDMLFNLGGQRVTTPRRGVYIENGKLVMKK